MNIITAVAKVVPDWNSSGKTIKQLHAKVGNISEEQLQRALKKLFKSMKIETIRLGNHPIKYRFCKGVNHDLRSQTSK